MSKRNPNSTFGAMCTAINSLPVGSTYRVKELREMLPSNCNSIYTVGWHHVRLLTTGCIQRVKRGTYKIIAHIPDFVTVSTCEGNGGYKRDRFTSGKTAKLRGKPWKLGDAPLVEEKKVEVKKNKVKRQAKSAFGILCTIINNLPIGTEYTIKELLVYVPQEFKNIPISNYGMRQGGVQHKIASAHSSLISTKCMERIGHNKFKIIAHIPDFVTVAITDVNRGYKEGKKWVLGDPQPEPTVRVKKEPVKKSYSDEVLGELVEDLEVMKGFHIINNVPNIGKVLSVNHPEIDVIILFYIYKGALRFAYVWNQDNDDNYLSEFLKQELHILYRYDNIDAQTTKQYIYAVMEYIKEIEDERIETDIRNEKEIKVKSKLLVIGKVEGMLRQAKPDQVVKAKLIDNNDEVYVLCIADDPNFIKVKLKTGIIHNVSIDDLVNIEYTSVPLFNKSVNQHRKEQIVAILKEGLSANDAADKIIQIIK